MTPKEAGREQAIRTILRWLKKQRPAFSTFELEQYLRAKRQRWDLKELRKP